MSNQRENRLVASVRVDPDGAILARSGAVALVEKIGPGVGLYRVTLVDAIAESECTIALCSAGKVVEEEAGPAVPTAVQINPVQFEVLTSAPNGAGGLAPHDAAFALTIHRVAP